VQGDNGYMPINCWASQTLNQDLRRLERWFGKGQSLVELRAVECAGLAALAIDEEVNGSLGIAGVCLVPVLSGLGEVVFA